MSRSEFVIDRREMIRGLAAAGVTEKIADGGFAEVSRPGLPSERRRVLPPGAGDRWRLARKCTGCQLCVRACPEKVLKPSSSLASFAQPELDFRDGYCRLACTRCGSVCPTTAIEKLSRAQRRHVHMGIAVWEQSLCLRTTQGESCNACARKCPAKAIHLVGDVPVVDAVACVGCGACEHVCPSRPEPAIHVRGYEVQRRNEPMDESQVYEEMRSLLQKGHSAVIARDGVIVKIVDGSGIGPILRLLDSDPDSMRGADIADKVVGRAAAAIYIAGGVKSVRAPVISVGACDMLSAHGILTIGEKVVPSIINRDGSGNCPMDEAISDLDDPQKMLTVLRSRIAD